MKILAIEFSSTQRSAAVVDSRTGVPPVSDEGVVFSKTGETPVLLSEAVQTSGGHTLAFALIEDALRQAKMEREEIDCLAVGLGPGSYTGIRVAISIAQGWQLAKAVRLLGVSSVDVLALHAQLEGVRGQVHLVIDAQRKEFYLATYEITEAEVRETEPLRLASLAEVQARAQTGGCPAGPEVHEWFPEGRVLFPRASTLGRLAATKTNFVSGDKLEPIYLRPTRFVKAPPPRVLPTF